MARKSKPAGPGHNSDALADQTDYRSALAMFVLIDQEKKSMNARHVRLRKRVCESKGIAQEDIKMMFKLKDEPLSDIVHHIKRKAHALGAMFGKAFQLDMFAPDPENGEALCLKGTLAGVSGDSAAPPPTLTPEERNIWLEGHHLGAKSREATILEMSAEFTEGEDGDYSESALTKRAKGKAKAVGLQAAKDFADDNPGVGGPTPEEQTFEASEEELAAQKPRQSQSERAAAKRAEAKIDA